MIACIKKLGRCCCPRCFVLRKNIWKLGTPADRRTREKHVRTDDAVYQSTIAKARRYIFSGVKWTSTKIKNLLDPHSWVGVRSAFSVKLSSLGLNVFDMLVPDALHELELGIFKHIFTHMLRILAELFPADFKERLAEINRR
jgi:hypothetical protein